ncbi:MAG: arylsulfatase [Gammaproteobacteria bacterium]|nr:arylsulfatase [Gammaproteobacteria bacterium]
MTNIPKPSRPFAGQIGRLFSDSEPEPLRLDKSPRGAPNILLVMLDDVGFGTCSTFGGPVPTPGVEKVASRGLLYNQFHTTALCSPTRAALLTGRNHHSVHMGGITEIANSFPAYDSAIPRETATIAEILKQNGYSTSCFGKWHLTPSWEQNPAGPFERWPTGMGFEKFYGILGAEASHWEPPVYDQITPIEPYVGRPDYHLSEDLADKAIEWISRQKVSAPDRPFFCYFAPPAVHAPHHVSEEWSDRFRGKFDKGWDALREDIFKEQLALGVVPDNTRLSGRPDQIPAWDDYPDRYKPVARRLMEVFAGFMAHTDAQVKRVLDSLEKMNCFDNTLVIYLTGDNGASAEGTIHGAWSAPSFQNGTHEDPEWLLDHIKDFGTNRCENHFNVGWAWALDSPFQWMKQVASHFGGTRNAMAISWPDKIQSSNSLRQQLHHVIDIFPTLLEAAGIVMPEQVNGILQKPVHGKSMLYTFDSPESRTTRTTQYFEILGNRAIYHDGWIASCFHGRLPWIRFAGFDFDGEDECWELYNVEDDFSQSEDLADLHPQKLEQLKGLFHQEAQELEVYPLRDAGSRRGGDYAVPHSLEGHDRISYTSEHFRMPEFSVLNLKNVSYNIIAKIELVDSKQSGVIVCQGGSMAGWALYIDEYGTLRFVYNWFGKEFTELSHKSQLNLGAHELRVSYSHDGGFGAGGYYSLKVNGISVDSARIDRTVPVIFSMSGETFDVGRNTGSPVSDYPSQFPFAGKIEEVVLERLNDKDAETLRKELEGRFIASLSAQ